MLGKVVIADKSRTVRRMVEVSLAGHPFELVFATDGPSALQAVRQHKAVALIADAALPGVDGYEVTRQLKGDPNTRAVRVLLLVGRQAQFDTTRGRQAGVDGHLSKPFLTQKMVQAVFTSLGQPVPDQALFKSSMMNIPLARKAEAEPIPAPAAPAPAAPAPRAAPEPPRAPVGRPQARQPAPTPPAPQRPSAPAPRAPAPPAALAPPAPAIQAAVAAASEALAGPIASSADLSGAPREVIEQIAWEVIPQLAEAILKEEIARLVRERLGA